MNERDKAILEAVRYFRALSRDDIIEMFFKDHKRLSYPNIVLKRLTDRGYLKQHKRFKPAFYTIKEDSIRLNSQKMKHYQAVYHFYRDVCKIEAPTEFQIEPRIGPKGAVEPDAYMVWKGKPHFIEIQRTRYDHKFIQAKLNKYEETFHQVQHAPLILLISDFEYKVTTYLPFKQAKNFKDYIKEVAPQFVSSGWNKLK